MTNSNRLSAQFQKAIAFSTLCVLGLTIFTASADARLIFTTEGDGTLLDEDFNGDGNFSLFFGENLEANIEFDTVNDRFNFNRDINVAGDVTAVDGTFTGDADVQGDLFDSTGNLTLNDSVDITGALDVQGGDITLENDETISNSTDGTVSIDATTTETTGGLDVQGAAGVTLSNDETITNAVDGEVLVTGDTATTGTLDVRGAGGVILSNDETITNAVDGEVLVTGDTATTGGLDVRGTAGITLENDETITNAVDGTLLFTATDTNTSGNLNVGGNLDVTGTSTLDGDVTLTADAQIINLRAENAATAGAPACVDATDLGRIYYDTDTETLLYCRDNGGVFGYQSTSAIAGNANETFVPEFSSFTTLADGTNNRGTLRAEFDDTADHGFYQWDTRRTALHDYDLVLQWKVPENFASFQVDPITVTFKTETPTLTDNQIDITGEDTAGTALTLTTATDLVGAVADTWEDQNVGITGGTFTPGELINLKFKVQADNTNTGKTYLGPVKINYVTQ